MKLIKQSFEILNQKDFTIKGIKQFIERCARVSYKSEDKITDTSYEKFVNTLEINDHSRPLEFGTVHIKMPYTEFERFKTLCDKLNKWNSIWIKYNISKSDVYITTNYRYYKDLCLAIDLDRGYVIPYLEDFSLQRYFTVEDNELFPKRYTVHMILSRAIMDEFRTHIGLSHLAESTRYCNYSKDKFCNSITAIIPNYVHLNYDTIDLSKCSISNNEYFQDTPFYNSNDMITRQFLEAMQEIEYYYFVLLQKGCKPQEARDVLPLNVKSELVSCGFKDAWDNFFYRRCDNTAHPMAIEIASQIKNSLY